MDGVHFRHIGAARGRGGSKGKVWNWEFNNGFAVTVLERKAGTKFGGHYHIGADPSKNPERMFLANGKVKAIFRKQDGYFEVHVFKPGDQWEIYPHVAHAFLALEDSVLLEFRVSHYNPSQPDTRPSDLEVSP